LHCAETEKIFTVYNSFGASYPVDGYWRLFPLQ